MIDRLLARIGSGFFQQAFVVADFEAAQRACVETLGCSPFVTLPATSLPYWYRGREVQCAIALGFARSGNVQIELLQPVSGEGVHVKGSALRFAATPAGGNRRRGGRRFRARADAA